MKIATIIGARPQIIKAAALSRAISQNFKEEISEVIIHTGQHYDVNMSQVFFDELGIPTADYNLDVGSGNHGDQTASMLKGIEEILLKEKPDALVVYGDTNSTLAGSIAASKLHIPVYHIEAGLRSFNKKMPEEINRILCDHVSTLLFSPTKMGLDNLKNEGFDTTYSGPYSSDKPGSFHCGDVMYDNTLYFKNLSNSFPKFETDYELKTNEFVLATIHRPSNTDDSNNFEAICKALLQISEDLRIVWPVHPRTKSKLKKLPNDLKNAFLSNDHIQLLEPVSFLEMIALESNCNCVLTDSGGVQKEAYFLKKPCVILREQTEWVELVENGCAQLVGADTTQIIQAYRYFRKQRLEFPQLFGDGNAGTFICQTMLDHFND